MGRTLSSANTSTSMAGTTSNVTKDGTPVTTSTTAHVTTTVKVAAGLTIKTIAISGNTSTLTSRITSENMLRPTPRIIPDHMSTPTPDIPSGAARGCENLLNIALQINLLVCIVFRY